MALLSGKLSNVDPGEETANLIVAQQEFEANPEALTTSHDLLGHVLDIKV